MYATLITKIKETLATVTQVKEAFAAPKETMTKFPCVFFKPDGLSNSFETNNENLAVYRFMMVVMVGTNEQLTPTHAFETTLPTVVDAIIAAFNKNWNAGTIEGHRVAVKIDSADAWQLSQEKEGLMAYAPLNVEIRLLTTN